MYLSYVANVLTNMVEHGHVVFYKNKQVCDIVDAAQVCSSQVQQTKVE